MSVNIKKAIRRLHLWLGLSSGLLVVFLGITGCILVFENEIEHFTAPYQYVTPQQKACLPPSTLKALAEQSLGADRKVVSLEYGGPARAAKAYYFNQQEYWLIFLDPYTGAVLKRKNMKRDFFRFIIDGHYNLWLPHSIGQLIVTSATLVFVVMMITGLILWWPKNKAARKQRFSIKWNSKWRRVNYDLHNVLGFYVTWACIFIALTGMVMGFQWFAKTTYWLSSGGHGMPQAALLVSDTTASHSLQPKQTTDIAWRRSLPLMRNGESLTVTFPATNTADIVISINHRPGTYYRQDFYHFDQYTLNLLPVGGLYDGQYATAPVAAKLNRMNYDIHVGAIGGLFTKVLAFFASLLAASLPVTGFLIWWGRRKKVPKPIAAKELFQNRQLEREMK